MRKLPLAFIVLATVYSSPAMSALSLTPGLWEVKSTIKNDGKVVDHQGQLKKSFDSMKPEQRKKMEAMMAKMGAAMPSADGAMKVCMSKEVLSQDDALMHKTPNQCETTVPTRTATKIEMNFKCKNGSSGTGEWNIKNNGNSYDGVMNMTSAQGKKTEISHHGRFVSADCGAVKPLLIKNLKPDLKRK